MRHRSQQKTQMVLPFNTNLCAGIPLMVPLFRHHRSAVVVSQYFHRERLQSIVFVGNIDNTAQIIERASQLTVWFVFNQDIPLALQYTYVGIGKHLRSISRKRQLRVHCFRVVVLQPFVPAAVGDIIVLQVVRFFARGVVAV